MPDLIETIKRMPDDIRSEYLRRLDEPRREMIIELLRLEKSTELYSGSPGGFIRDRIGDHLWSKQHEIIESVANNPRTIVPASHGVGKSFIAARTVAWWVETKPQPLVVTSAPSFPQVKNILWRELNRAHKAGDLSGRCNLTDWVRDREVVAFGRKPAANSAEQVFQGVHSLNLLVVLDEAGGIPAWLWDEASKLMTNKNSRLLAIGNPDEEGSIFHRESQKPSNSVITISAYDSPAFTEETVPEHVVAELVTEDWVREQAETYGEDSAVFKRRVLAQFVVDATDGVIPRSWILDNQRENSGEPPKNSLIQVGIDVAAGGDLTVLQAIEGHVATEQLSFREKDPLVQARQCADFVRATGAQVAKLDKIGVGHHLVGHLQEMLPEVDVIGVSVAERSSDTNMWPLVRDEMWWKAREHIRSGEWDLANVDQGTVEQLASVRYKQNPKKQIKIEPKAEIIKRIGSSPDKAEALLLAYWEADSWIPEQATSLAYAKQMMATQTGIGMSGAINRGL